MSQFSTISSKIHTKAAILKTVAQWRAAGDKIVFTNGCFDILHYGHLHYLADARDQGDRLVVGLNSKDSVQRLKGPSRPVNDEETRSHMLAALEMVDALVIFEEDTPLLLIEAIQPDILVKGGDWKPEQIVGADIVLKRGGQVLSLPFVAGYSTTNIVEKILSNK